MDMTEPLVEDLKKLEKRIIAYDAFLKSDVFLIAPIICCLCDNVRASELINHLGSKAIKLCRFCMVRIILAKIMQNEKYNCFVIAYRYLLQEVIKLLSHKQPNWLLSK